MNKFSHLLQSAEESDVYLAAGVAALFVGTYLIYPPAGFILIGLVFCALSYLIERGVKHGNA